MKYKWIIIFPKNGMLLKQDLLKINPMFKFNKKDMDFYKRKKVYYIFFSEKLFKNLKTLNLKNDYYLYVITDLQFSKLKGVSQKDFLEVMTTKQKKSRILI